MTDVLYSFIFVMVFFIDQLYRTHGCIQYRKQNSAMFSTFTKGLPYLPNGFLENFVRILYITISTKGCNFMEYFEGHRC